MSRIELLSPAGSFDALKAAVNYGADAVYLGGSSFSARAFAANFDHDEMIEAVKYCHLRGVKIYVTLNTLLTEKELERAMEEARFYYEHDVDALIIQDLGLFYRIRTEMPDFSLHASTQMHIHNINGVRNAKKLGFKKVVLARESSLELIKEACKEDIEIECFIHGALCVSYSGQCLMSSVTKNRSANKGMCAQSCRLRYNLKDSKGRQINTDTEYLLSPKDMNLIDSIPLLIDAGVSSLKIEGRLKSPAYVGLVTKTYREAIDAYYEGIEYHLTRQRYNELLEVFNRGFTDSYLKDDDTDIFGNRRPNHIGKRIGTVIDQKNGRCFIKLDEGIRQFDGIRIISDREDQGKILNTLTVNKKYVSAASKGEVIEINIDSPVRKGDVVVKTLNNELEKSIDNYNPKKRALDIKLYFKENENIRVQISLDDLTFEKKYDMRPDEARNAPVTEEELLSQFSRTDENPFYVRDFKTELGHAFMPKGRLNELRRKIYKDLEAYILSCFKRCEPSLLDLPEIGIRKNEEGPLIEDHTSFCIERYRLLKDPVINQKSVYLHPETCSEFGNILSNEDDKTAYYTMNVSNSYAYEFLTKLGYSRIILSTELSDSQIYDLIDAFQKRNGYLIRPYVLIHGRRVLMYIKRDPFAKYVNDSNGCLLSDGENSFDIVRYPEYTELLESHPHRNVTINRNRIQPFIIIHDSYDLNVIRKDYPEAF